MTKLRGFLAALAMLLLVAGVAPDGWAQEVDEALDAAAATTNEAFETADLEPDGDADVETVLVDAEDDVVEVDAAEEEEAPLTAEFAHFTSSNVFMMFCAALVFIMHLGFGCVEIGLTRAKNAVNILCKNAMIISMGILLYAICGFNLMYPPGFEDNSASQQFFGFGGPWITGDSGSASGDYNSGYTYWTDFLFQAMFAATAATIVSGAVAERIKLGPFLVISMLLIGVSYPITGSWKWGYGFLDDRGFYDFAGSTIVHGVGGMAALVTAAILGPRLGKYAADGTVQPIPGHSMPFAFIGVIVLWLGWFGFNGGSVLSHDAEGTSLVLVNTSIAAASGAIAAYFTTRIGSGKPELSMILNGILAGLVGITAGADQMNPAESSIIGLIAGVLVVLSVYFFDKIRVDDPVGAISVHLVCGIFGTLVVGVLGTRGFFRIGGGEVDAEVGYSLVTQIIGCFSMLAFTAVFMLIVVLIVKAVMGLRVSEEEEIEGLDLGEHDMSAYPDFQQTFIKSYHAREI